MTELILSVVSSAVVSSLFFCALFFLTKTWIGERIKRSIEHEYAEKLEAYKAKLAAENAIELERTRSALTIATTEHQIRFSKLHEKQAEVVAETYSRLGNYRSAVLSYSSPFGSKTDPPLPEQRAAVNNANKEFWDYFRPNEIYFPVDAADKVIEFAKTLYGISNEWYFVAEDAPESGPSLSRADRWRKEGEPLLSQEGQVFDRLRDLFRNLTDADVKSRQDQPQE
jgi:hypothetical protein